MVINFFGRRNFMQPMGRPKHTLNVPCIFTFSVWGAGDLEEDVFPGSHYVDHPTILAGPSREGGGGGAPTNQE
jgi:hypothetical protein